MIIGKNQTYIEHFTKDNYPEKCTSHDGNQIDIIENNYIII